jgi:maleate isomerase
MAETGLAYAPKGLVGLLTPQANTTVEPEFAILCPPGYGVIAARLTRPAPQMIDRLSQCISTPKSEITCFSDAPIPFRPVADGDGKAALRPRPHPRRAARRNGPQDIPLIDRLSFVRIRKGTGWFVLSWCDLFVL